VFADGEIDRARNEAAQRAAMSARYGSLLGNALETALHNQAQPSTRNRRGCLDSQLTEARRNCSRRLWEQQAGGSNPPVPISAGRPEPGPGRQPSSKLQVGIQERLGRGRVDSVLEVGPVAAIAERPGVQRDDCVAVEQWASRVAEADPPVIFKNRSGKASCTGIELTCR
jgi:hypothetical protein